jgi:hypothetical protein
MSDPTYPAFVTQESAQIRARVREVHGREPTPSEYAHHHWRRLKEGWGLQSLLRAVDPAEPQVPEPDRFSIDVNAQDGSTGLLVPGATVRVTGGLNAGVSGVTTPAGYVTLRNLIEGTLNLSVTADGYRPGGDIVPLTRDLLGAEGVFLQLQPGTARHGLVRANGKSLADDAGPFQALGTSFFWNLWGLRADRGRTIQNLDALAAVDAIRILCCVGEDGDPNEDTWWDRTVDPTWPDFQAVLRDGFRLVGARNKRVIVTVFGDVTSRVPTPADRLAHLDRVLDVCLEFPEQVLNIGISNEGIGFDDIDEILALTQRVRDRTPFLVSSVSSLDSPPATVFAGRTDRKVTGDGGMWEHTEQPYDLREASVGPASDEEPIGIASSVANDDDSLRHAAHAATAWICGAPIYVIHTGAGTRGGGDWDVNPGPGASYPKREANFFDQPTFAETVRLCAIARDFLPAGVSGWGNWSHSDPSHEGRYPFRTGPLQPFDPSGWFLKTYATRRGQDYALVILKIERDVPLEAPAPMTYRLSDLRGGVRSGRLEAGERLTVTERGAVVVTGRFD